MRPSTQFFVGAPYSKLRVRQVLLETIRSPEHRYVFFARGF